MLETQIKVAMPDPMDIDMDAMEVSPDKKIKVVHVLSTIVIGKPNKTDFVRVRSGDGYAPVTLYTYSPDGSGKDSKNYLVMPICHSFMDELGVLTPSRFYLYQVLGSKVMKLDMISQRTDKNGNLNRYHETHQECLEAGMVKWIRMRTVEDAGYYAYAYAEDLHPEPDWSHAPPTLKTAIKIAFKGFIIDSMEHPEILKLRGKAVVPTKIKSEA